MARRFGRNQKRRLKGDNALLQALLDSCYKSLRGCRKDMERSEHFLKETSEEARRLRKKLRTKGWKVIKSQHDGIEQIEFIAVVDWDGDLGEEIDGAPGYKE